MNITSFDEAFFKYYTDNRSAISDTRWRTNVRAWKTRALELLSVSTSWQSFSLLVNHNVKSVWFQILSERTWFKRERSLDSTRPAIRTADSTLAFSAGCPPSCGRNWDVEKLATIDFYPTPSPPPPSRIERRLLGNGRTGQLKSTLYSNRLYLRRGVSRRHQPTALSAGMSGIFHRFEIAIPGTAWWNLELYLLGVSRVARAID